MRLHRFFIEEKIGGAKKVRIESADLLHQLKNVFRLEKGDEIMSINFKPVAKMTLEEIDSIFKSRDGRGILLEIFHDHRYDKVILTLKRRI